MDLQARVQREKTEPHSEFYFTRLMAHRILDLRFLMANRGVSSTTPTTIGGKQYYETRMIIEKCNCDLQRLTSKRYTAGQ